MMIWLNGKKHATEKTTSVSSLLESIGLGKKPVIVELNQKALFPREYSEKMLNDGDHLEIITIAAGG